MTGASGFLNINKPSGWTSFDVVAALRRLTGIRRIGHGGTIDPQATGVLPVGIGGATRMLEYLLTASKQYVGRVRLGSVTTTYDAEGRVTAESDVSQINRDQVERALSAFTGRIAQIPPQYSALKKGGQPLYKLARAGIAPPLEPRPVDVYQITLVEWSPPYFTLEVECGRGTYIRSLAHDIGQALGCGAHLSGLLRTRVGPFLLQEAVALEDLLDGILPWQSALFPADLVALHLPAAILDLEAVVAARDGRYLPQDSPTDTDSRYLQSCRAYGPSGELIAMLSYDQSLHAWKPAKVFLRDG